MGSEEAPAISTEISKYMSQSRKEIDDYSVMRVFWSHRHVQSTVPVLLNFIKGRAHMWFVDAWKCMVNIAHLFMLQAQRNGLGWGYRLFQLHSDLNCKHSWNFMCHAHHTHTHTHTNTTEVTKIWLTRSSPNLVQTGLAHSFSSRCRVKVVVCETMRTVRSRGWGYRGRQ